jgi:MoaA/NifB/PqqE/SkfB family radical SAM enzyme
MCFNWDGMMKRRAVSDMTVEDITKLASSMGTLPQLTLSGGEPLLRDDLHEIIQAFYDRAYTRFFGLPTNALMPDRVGQIIDYFVANCQKAFLNFCLPLHGTEETFDDIMGVPGSFQKLQETYDLVLDAKRRHPNISFVMNCVMSKFNYRDYKAIIRLAETTFPDAPFGFAYARGVTHDRDATEFDVESYKAANSHLAQRRTVLGKYNPYTIMFSTIGPQVCDTIDSVERGAVTTLNCKAGRSLLVIYDDGTVHPCELLDVVGIPPGEAAPESSCMGHLSDFDYDLPRLLASERAMRVVDWIRTHDCACTWECAIYRTILHSPAKLARLGVNIIRYLL